MDTSVLLLLMLLKMMMLVLVRSIKLLLGSPFCIPG
jgi:hypothetical protein